MPIVLKCLGLLVRKITCLRLFEQGGHSLSIDFVEADSWNCLSGRTEANPRNEVE